MQQLEKTLQKYAIYDTEKIVVAPVDDFIDFPSLLPLSEGLQSRVYKLKNSDWVVKEGRWDIKLEPGIQIPKEIFTSFMEFLSLKLLPKPQEVLRQYRQYLDFLDYFGYFLSPSGEIEKNVYYHPDIDNIAGQQKSVRNMLHTYVDDINTYYSIRLNTDEEDRLSDLLKTDVKYVNFAPKEYLLYGKSFSPENEGENTYYIFQEFIEGRMLHDVDESEFTPRLKTEFILFVFLILLMNMQIHIVPDTRPRNYLTQSYDWLTMTDNIIIQGDKLKFIDTRWFWETNKGLLDKGIILSDMIVKLSSDALVRFLKEL